VTRRLAHALLALAVVVAVAAGRAVPSAAAAPAGGGDIASSLPCSACHSTDTWKTRATQTGAAGGFDHSKTGFPLTGLHAGAACVACHVANRPTPKRDCVSCHDDWHRGRLSSACDRCHTAMGWKVTRPLEIHRFTRFPLTGMHALADCNECHKRAADHQWTGAPVDCFGCHEKEYLRPNLRPPHQGQAGTEPFSRDCSGCHRSIAWAPAFIRLTATGVAPQGLTAQSTPPRGHDLRFPIGFGPHRLASCPDCHTSPSVPQAVRCVGCHAHDPARLLAQHRQPVAAIGSGCLGCHPGGARR
jgi:hypothetical protein